MVREIEEIENRLIKVMRQNSTGNPGEQVYARQDLLNQATDEFYNLRIEIQQQYISFESHRLVGDPLSDIEIEQRQVELRHTMETVEKQYKDVKFNCFNFLFQMEYKE